MFIVVTEPCCNREPFEKHKEDCYFKRQKKEMDEFLHTLIKKFMQDQKGQPMTTPEQKPKEKPTELEKAAKKAARTGNLKDLQEYLKMRRNFR